MKFPARFLTLLSLIWSGVSLCKWIIHTQSTVWHWVLVPVVVLVLSNVWDYLVLNLTRGEQVAELAALRVAETLQGGKHE